MALLFFASKNTSAVARAAAAATGEVRSYGPQLRARLGRTNESTASYVPYIDSSHLFLKSLASQLRHGGLKKQA